MSEEMIELIAKIEQKEKLIEQYGYELTAMRKRLYAMAHKAQEDKRQLELF